MANNDGLRIGPSLKVETKLLIQKYFIFVEIFHKYMGFNRK